MLKTELSVTKILHCNDTTVKKFTNKLNQKTWKWFYKFHLALRLSVKTLY